MKKRATKVSLGLLVLVLAVGALAYVVLARGAPGPSIAVDPTGKRINIAGGVLPPGCRCHSADKKVVDEHKKYGITDCAKCHPKK